LSFDVYIYTFSDIGIREQFSKDNKTTAVTLWFFCIKLSIKDNFVEVDKKVANNPPLINTR